MLNKTLKIRFATPADNEWLDELMNKEWGGSPLVIRGGKKYYLSQLTGIIAENSNRIVGFLFYEICKTDCEIILFQVFEKFKGTGTIILEALKKWRKMKIVSAFI